MKKIMIVIGTRPEAIKLAPIIAAFENNKYFSYEICMTGQHKSLLNSVLSDMNIKVSYKFQSTESKGSLCHSATHMLSGFSNTLEKSRPDLIIVQGDTTTAFVAALASFYSGIAVAHIEAGLRTNNIYSPWPEEIHRCFIDKVSTHFFAPTNRSKINLINEGVPIDKIWVVGNTSIDAVRLINKKLCGLKPDYKTKFILVTIHRRENYGEPLKEVCNALRNIAKQFLDINIMFCLHPNPSISEHVKTLLSNISNINLISPINHISFIKLLKECLFVITDSGGIQEEVTFIGKPALIVRDITERPEVIENNIAILVGTKAVDIINICNRLLKNPDLLAVMSKICFPYGDGYAAKKIVNILEQELKKN